MKYSTGENVDVGDIVQLWDGCTGEVVCSLDDGIYSEKYTEEDWKYLKNGVLIFTNQAGLIHYIKPEDNMALIKRH